MRAIYWLLHNLHPNYRSSLHAIQLAVLCKTSVVKEHVYGKILHLLIQDLVTLEEQGLYLQQLGASIKGTVLYVAVDNLAAHFLAGFYESFTANHMCRFMATRDEMQVSEVTHDKHVEDVSVNPTMSKECGVKSSCILRDKISCMIF